LKSDADYRRLAAHIELLQAVKKASDMVKRKLSDWEKLQARTDYRANRGRQFSSVDIADVHVEDWTDEYGKAVVTVQNENKPQKD
jgi:hypothetical protein